MSQNLSQITASANSKANTPSTLFVTAFRLRSSAPPTVVGPRDPEVLQFFRNVKAGFLLKLGGVEGFISIVWIDDLIEGILRATFSEHGIGETFFINTIDEISIWEAQYLMAEVMKVEIRPLRIPLWLLRAVAGIVEKFETADKKPPMLSRDKVKELAAPFWITSSAKARSLLGFDPQTDIREALRRTYEWYRNQRWL